MFSFGETSSNQWWLSTSLCAALTSFVDTNKHSSTTKEERLSTRAQTWNWTIFFPHRSRLFHSWVYAQKIFSLLSSVITIWARKRDNKVCWTAIPRRHIPSLPNSNNPQSVPSSIVDHKKKTISFFSIFSTFNPSKRENGGNEEK